MRSLAGSTPSAPVGLRTLDGPGARSTIRNATGWSYPGRVPSAHGDGWCVLVGDGEAKRIVKAVEIFAADGNEGAEADAL
jgi:hypothetical protein